MSFNFQNLRFVGQDNFNSGVVLDISFSDIIPDINNFLSVIGLNKDNKPIGKPRFTRVVPQTHCEMPMLTNDYYLIGFTDVLNRSSEKFRFLFEHCGGEYITKDGMKAIQNFKSYPHDCYVLSRI